MSARILFRCAAALAVAILPFASVAPAHGFSSYTKPLTTHHVDRAPSVPGASSPQVAIPGVPGPVPWIPRVDGSGGGEAHILAPLVSGGGGTNLISFANFGSGDIVVVLDPLSITGHAGLFDRRFYTDIRSYAVLSANMSPANGVQREQCLKYRSSDRAYGLWVPSEANHSLAARNFAYSQMGKPYSIASSKTDLRSFYCSKLVWAAWRFTSGLDLDGDGGFWVWPVDLITSSHTRLFGYWS